jgi:hypothetical protein
MKFNKKWVVISIVVTLLLAMMFFKREGYTLSSSQMSQLSQMFTARQVSPADQAYMSNVIAAYTPGSEAPPEYKAGLEAIDKKYPGLFRDITSAFIQPANAAARQPAQSLAANTMSSRGFACRMANDNRGISCRLT